MIFILQFFDMNNVMYVRLLFQVVKDQKTKPENRASGCGQKEVCLPIVST